MGDVEMTVQIMPKEMEGFEQLKHNIIDKMKNGTGGLVKGCNIGEREVAFGMKALIVKIIIPDGEGGSDKIEEKLKEIENVSTCDTTNLDRLGV
ncbi:elongation factor 1-beta [Candidatus Micrarchaeota archaeon CG10_big_fil_rev_8_21_14_0_10_45_29]|nr:MAG: elongation factor 1-beta [Candidatus Micrarchaeota archaeon CG10_big_fil_rev_8_21_14_0_10_45_29]